LSSSAVPALTPISTSLSLPWVTSLAKNRSL
jgi:hypothetical protein